MEYRFIYITCKDKTEAKKIAYEIIHSRLAACTNIISEVESIYNWDGKVCDDKESVLIAKTRSTLVSKLVKRVKSIHSYSCPCIVSLPIHGGHVPFLEWIASETQTVGKEPI